MERSYWARVHREAWARARHSVIGTALSIVTVCAGFVAVVWGLTWYGSSGAAHDSLVEGGTRILVGIALWAVTYLYWIKQIPSDWDEEKNRQIKDFQLRTEPRLRFEFSLNDNKYLQEIPLSLEIGFRDFWIGRVSLRNPSTSDSVFGAEATLVHYRRGETGEAITVDRKLTAPSSDKLIINIHAQRAENFDLFRIRSNGKANGIELGPFVGDKYLGLPPDKYVIKITASANDMNRIYQIYFLELDSDKQITFRPWQPGDTQHDFNISDINQSGLVQPQLRQGIVQRTRP